RGKLLRLLAATLAASLVGLLIIDMSLYRLYHFHFNGIVLHFILGGGLQEIVGLSSQEYLLLSLLLGLLFLFEYGLAWLCWHKIHLHRWAYFSTLHALAPSCLLLSYLLFFSAAASADSKDNTVLENTHAIVMQATILPLYHNLIATLFPISLTDSMRSGEGMFTQQAQKTHTLYYPQHPLHFSPPTHLPNIVIIGLDAWRFDMMTPEVSPHIYAFSKRCLQFTEHWSGGNGTEPGLFSLFYSLPSTYWSSAIVTGQSPLLIHELSKFGYKLGLFVSAETYSPPYNKTIYREVPHMPTRTPGDEPYQRDAYITHAFDQFIKQQDQQHPFFSFVFYNTTHSYCTANPYPHVFLPQTEECNRLQLDNDFDPTPFRNRYKNAVHYVDGLVGQVLLTLEKNHQLDNTLVLILGDHGEEFNDNHTDAWGHAGNFTRYQLQTPLLIYWPGKSPQRYTHQTTHFDIVPTLFNHVFNCKNPSQDYSIGHDLFDSNPRPYIVVGSYIDFGIVEKGRITRILPGGNLEILDDHNQLLSAKPSIEIVKQAFGDTQRFYHI
ncbi:MAG: sulfatase-like hydrolase/transferase, partial [Gammaproteobacteria bacterium]|nr:sulfatase-like hydrolase/transferase [Gammaproteobacteria bacterium]